MDRASIVKMCVKEEAKFIKLLKDYPQIKDLSVFT
jgi:hypothetical protein